MNQKNLCPASTLAKLLGLTERRIQQLALEGHVMKGGRGEYELVGSIQKYIAYCESRGNKVPSGGESLSFARRQLIEAQTEKTRFELAILRKEWVTEGELREVVSEITQKTIRGLESLPGRLAVVLANEHDPAVVRQTIQVECRQIRRELSQALYERGAFYEKQASAPVSSGQGDENYRDTDAE